jgi:hypothetical protein
MSYCYAVRVVGETEIKFGYAKDPKRRLKQLQTGQPKRLELIVAWPVAASLGELPDKAIHRRFATHRINPDGEWFSGAPDVLAFVDEMLADPNSYQRQQEAEIERRNREAAAFLQQQLDFQAIRHQRNSLDFILGRPCSVTAEREAEYDGRYPNERGVGKKLKVLAAALVLRFMLLTAFLSLGFWLFVIVLALGKSFLSVFH